MSSPKQPGKPAHDYHQPETSFSGELAQFTVEALAPDDPRLEPRERRGRPDSAGTSNSDEVEKPSR